ncbi:MAG: LysM domain-containing protein, partial [Vicingaceae bacterium]
QKEIVAANPELSEGLKDEQVLKIPIKEIKIKIDPEPVVENTKYNTHRVQQGETLYSLSKLYNTTSDSIRIVNN